jgi:uncharacterized SAM-binding protein YcdF (DUF218 family)
LLLLLVIGVLAWQSDRLLAATGHYLVREDPPVPSDVIVVLAGDGWGHRVVKAAGLAAQGLAPVVLVSGPPGAYGNYECELAIPFVVKKGYDERPLVCFKNDANSTAEEARNIAAELRQRGAKSILLVTSNYHTRRSGRIFRRELPDLQVRVVAARDQYFEPGQWWRSRQGQKTWLMEWAKTVAEWVGL